MKTSYAVHDEFYKRKRKAGEAGWDSPAGSAKTYEDLCAAIQTLDLPASPVGLELGCGAGDLTIRFAQDGWRMHGVDISGAAIQWARDKADKLNLDIEFFQQDISRNTTPAIEPVDVVIDGHCLHCIIGKDRQSFFRIAKRCLRAGGYLIIDTMCGDPCTQHFRQHFDAGSRCIVYDGVAARYLGVADSILAEIVDAGFQVLTSRLHEATEPDDQHTLLVVAQPAPQICSVLPRGKTGPHDDDRSRSNRI